MSPTRRPNSVPARARAYRHPPGRGGERIRAIGPFPGIKDAFFTFFTLFMQQDFSAIAPLELEQIKIELAKLHLVPGDTLIVRRSDCETITRAEAARIRETVLKAFEGHPFKPAILFADGYELAVIHGQ